MSKVIWWRRDTILNSCEFLKELNHNDLVLVFNFHIDNYDFALEQLWAESQKLA